MDEWLKVSEVARRLGVQNNTVYRLIEAGKLPASGGSKVIAKANGTLAERREATRVSVADLEAFIDAARLKPGELRKLYDS